jgi:hypothetical protein
MDQGLRAETWLTEIMGEVGENDPRREAYVRLMARALRAQGKTEEAKAVCGRLEGWLAIRKCRRE